MTRLNRMASVGVTLVVIGVALRALWARLPGWNPESLWNDDLVWGAIIRCFRHQVFGEESLSPNHPDTSSRF